MYLGKDLKAGRKGDERRLKAWIRVATISEAAIALSEARRLKQK